MRAPVIGELSDTGQRYIWPRGKAVQRATLLREFSAPENRVGTEKLTYSTVRYVFEAGPDNTSPGPCVWRVATFVAPSHSTNDNPFSCGLSACHMSITEKSWNVHVASRDLELAEECYRHAAPWPWHHFFFLMQVAMSGVSVLRSATMDKQILGVCFSGMRPEPRNHMDPALASQGDIQGCSRCQQKW